jgi:hypothetical protein
MSLDVTNAMPHESCGDMGRELEALKLRLFLIPAVEKGYGVVPVFEEGCSYFRPGEVAVYKEETPRDLIPGLYCVERQRTVASSPFPESPRIVEREVVYARDHPKIKDCWEYISLKSKVIRGVRRYAVPQGPYINGCRGDMLLGPIVGIYMPVAQTSAG